MPSQPPTVTGGATPSYPPCVEHGIWTPIPVDPPSGAHRLTLKDIDPDESSTVKQRGVMTFHTVGCSGDFKDHVPGSQVAKAMATQISDPRAGGGNSAAVAASFLYHLGDLVYKDEDPSDPDGKDQALMYNSQFYAQYASYGRTFSRSRVTMTQKPPTIRRSQRSFISCKTSATRKEKRVRTIRRTSD